MILLKNCWVCVKQQSLTQIKKRSEYQSGVLRQRWTKPKKTQTNSHGNREREQSPEIGKENRPEKWTSLTLLIALHQ